MSAIPAGLRLAREKSVSTGGWLQVCAVGDDANAEIGRNRTRSAVGLPPLCPVRPAGQQPSLEEAVLGRQRQAWEPGSELAKRDHPPLGQARQSSVGAIRPAHRLDLHLRRHLSQACPHRPLLRRMEQAGARPWTIISLPCSRMRDALRAELKARFCGTKPGHAPENRVSSEWEDPPSPGAVAPRR